MAEDSQGERREIAPRYSSYKDFIEKNVEEWPQYRWLQIFFNHGGGSPEDTKCTVFDSFGDRLIETPFSPSDSGRFRGFLNDRSPEVKTRIILLGYKETWSVDRTFVDIVASHLCLDPDDLDKHLKHNYQRSESIPSYLRKMLVSLVPDDYGPTIPRARNLPSEFVENWKSLHFNGKDGDRSSMTFANSPQHKGSIVLILLRQSISNFTSQEADRLGYNDKPLPPIYDPGKHIYNKVITSIRKMSGMDMLSCDTSPALYSYHVLRPWLVGQSHDRALSTTPDYLDILGPSNLESEIEGLQFKRVNLRSVRLLLQTQNLIDLQSRRNSQTLEIVVGMKELIDDVDFLCTSSDMALAERNRLVNRNLKMSQIEEAEWSTSTATSVASLTRIATIYIPLNFTASFFGMNMAEFGNGTGRLWTFVITALILACLTSLPFTYQIIDWIQGRPTMQENPWVIILRMTYYFPVQGFWLALFSLFHSLEMLALICEDGLYEYVAGRKDKGELRYLREHQLFANFWRERLKGVFEVLEHPDWKKRSFVSRVWMKLFTKRQILPTSS